MIPSSPIEQIKKPLICFRTDDDADAIRAGAVLEALGYRIVREFDVATDGAVRLQWTVIRFARKYKLTTREQDILEYMIAGHNNIEIGELMELSRETVKWHKHNIFTKANVDSHNKLLSLVYGFSADPDECVDLQPEPRPEPA